MKIQSLRRSNELSNRQLKYFNSSSELDILAERGLIKHYKLINPIDDKVVYLFDINDIEEFVYNKMIMRSEPIQTSFILFDELNTMPTKDLPNELRSYYNDVYELPLHELYAPPGVYFLYDNDNLVYIGQSVHIKLRIITHMRENKKKFNKCFFIKVSKEKLFEVETTLINKYKPIYNQKQSVYTN